MIVEIKKNNHPVIPLIPRQRWRNGAAPTQLFFFLFSLFPPSLSLSLDFVQDLETKK